MAMPVKIKTHVLFAACERFAWTGSHLTAHVPMIYRLKEAFMAVPGATVKGSSDSLNGGMDAVDRWTDVTKVVHYAGINHSSWIVIRFANMGNLEVFIEVASNASASTGATISWSPTGAFTGGSAASYPTASDAGNSTSLAQSVTADQIFSFSYANDGTQLYYLKAVANSYTHFTRAEMVDSAITNGNPPSAVVWTTAQVIAPSTSSPAQAFRVRINGGSGYTIVTPIIGFESFGASAPSTLTVMELQGNKPPIHEISLWYSTAPHRGKIGNIIDLWWGITTVPHGSTYPENGDREFIAYGPIMLPWDGAPGVPGTPVVMA